MLLRVVSLPIENLRAVSSVERSNHDRRDLLIGPYTVKNAGLLPAFRRAEARHNLRLRNRAQTNNLTAARKTQSEELIRLWRKGN